MDKVLTVIVPSYNMEAYLRQGLDSLIVADKELLDLLEVMVVNDGSKDGTSVIAHEYASRYPGVFSVIDKENGHYGSCINAALKMARGRYVKVLDADDSVDKVGFETLLREILELPVAVDAIIADYSLVDPDGKVRGIEHIGLPARRKLSARDLPYPQDRFIGIHALAYLTESLRCMNYTQTEGVCYSDIDWTVLPFAKVSSVWYCPVVVTRYLIGRDGQSMDPVAYARNYWMIGKVLTHILQEYQRASAMATEDSRVCFDRMVLFRLATAYSDTLWGFSLHDGVRRRAIYDLRELDANISKYAPGLYAKLEDIHFGGRCNGYYIREWRRRKSDKTLRFMWMRIVHAVWVRYAKLRSGKSGRRPR